MSSIKELRNAAADIYQWLNWDEESLSDFHAYAQRFGVPGENVHSLVLRDALKLRGLTLQQLRAGKDGR